MKSPTVNVIVSLDYELMQEFQAKKSLADFRAKMVESQRSGKGLTGFYENTINDSLISLNHTMGKDGTAMSIEFTDPHETFEKSSLSPVRPGFVFDMNVLNQISGNPAETLVAQKWETFQRIAAIDDIVKNSDFNTVGDMMSAAMDLTGVRPFLSDTGYLNNSNGGRDAWLRSVGMKSESNEKTFIAGLIDLQRKLREELLAITGNDPGYNFSEDDLPDMDDQNVGEINRKVIQLLQQKAGLSLQAPIWIAYGIGDDIQRDWSKPTTYGMVREAEYGFAGDGARVIKLSFGGVGGVGTALSKLGLSPLGDVSAGVGPSMLITGGSNRLFNIEEQTGLTETLTGILNARKEVESLVAIPSDLRVINPPPPGAFGGAPFDWAELSAQIAMTTYFPTAQDGTFGAGKRFGTETRSWRSPSFHYAIKTAMRNYIRACLPAKYRENVIVLMPNLDPHLTSTAQDHFAGLSLPHYAYLANAGTDKSVSLLTSSWVQSYANTIEQCNLTFGRGWGSRWGWDGYVL